MSSAYQVEACLRAQCQLKGSNDLGLNYNHQIHLICVCVDYCACFVSYPISFLKTTERLL